MLSTETYKAELTLTGRNEEFLAYSMISQVNGVAF